MVSRKITAVILCFAMIIGMTGCKEKSRDKDKAEIEKLVSEYSQALKDYDLKALYRISSLEEDENFNWRILPVMDEQKLIGINGEKKESGSLNTIRRSLRLLLLITTWKRSSFPGMQLL